MKLAAVSYDGARHACRVDDEEVVLLEEGDVEDVLARPDWPEYVAHAVGRRCRRADVTFRAPLRRPSKIVCAGLNYRDHITEIGVETPRHPTLFAKYAEAIVGPTDPIRGTELSREVDWEAELAVVIGRQARRVDAEGARQAIAGFTVANDVSMRDMQNRTPEWLQGKTFEETMPLGPTLVTPDELAGGAAPDLAITCRVNGELVQSSRTDQLLFSTVDLIAYVTQIVSLVPGDLILTGTPSGVGAGHRPPRFLQPGDTLVTEIEGIGRLTNELTPPQA